jgi:hypothetical protein
MKWKTVNKVSKQGDKRTKRKFALFPVKTNDYTVWLETYDSVQEYRWYGAGGIGYSWDEVERIPLFPASPARE